MFSFSVYTLGCKLNQLESEALADAFRREGGTSIPWGQAANEGAPAADILLINTCTVTSKADQKARRLIRKSLRDNPRACVIVTGCYAQLEARRLTALGAEFPGANRLFVVSADQKGGLLDLGRYLQHGVLRDLLVTWADGL
ncbi:MAG: hypothetical protein LBN21_13090, partial [Treponema sp.]|nr:hypothetical protein [Treponema sp.]